MVVSILLIGEGVKTGSIVSSVKGTRVVFKDQLGFLKIKEQGFALLDGERLRGTQTDP